MGGEIPPLFRDIVVLCSNQIDLVVKKLAYYSKLTGKELEYYTEIQQGILYAILTRLEKQGTIKSSWNSNRNKVFEFVYPPQQ